VAAVPSIGRATRVERKAAPGADAAGELYERYSAQIFGYCLHQLGSREEAEDAVQTTFMNAFRGLSRGIVPELESAWLFKIAHNVCLSRRRSSWRRGKIEAPNNFEVLQEIIPGRDETVGDELIRLQDVLEEMPEHQRRAILLREWQGLTYREISAELGLTQAAVETLIFRARRALAQGLEQDADTWKRRLRRGADVGGAIACFKALLGGGGAAAVKVAATALAVATATVAATTQITPRHPHHARPAKHTSTTRAGSPSHSAHLAMARFRAVTAASGGALTHRSSSGATHHPSSAERTLPHPVAAPAADPGATTAATSAEKTATPAPTPAPAQQSEATSSTATPPPATAPADNGHGKGKGKKGERQTQATAEAIDPTMTDPEPLPAATAQPPAEQPQDSAPGQDKKSDKSANGTDRSGKGKGNDGK
jgi:RNA polymerase sigma factor (sigma-70 family)